MACRRFPRLHIRIDYKTPSSLCVLLARTVPDDHIAQGPILSRVPAARDFGLT